MVWIDTRKGRRNIKPEVKHDNRLIYKQKNTLALSKSDKLGPKYYWYGAVLNSKGKWVMITGSMPTEAFARRWLGNKQ